MFPLTVTLPAWTRKHARSKTGIVLQFCVTRAVTHWATPLGRGVLLYGRTKRDLQYWCQKSVVHLWNTFCHMKHKNCFCFRVFLACSLNRSTKKCSAMSDLSKSRAHNAFRLLQNADDASQHVSCRSNRVKLSNNSIYFAKQSLRKKSQFFIFHDCKD